MRRLPRPVRAGRGGWRPLRGCADLCRDLVGRGDACALDADFARAEVYFAAAARAARSEGLRTLAWQRLSAALLARVFESERPHDLLRRALSAADAALAQRPCDALARFCKASALFLLGKIHCAGETLRPLLADNLGCELGPDVELQARALFVRCCALGAGSPRDVLREADVVRRLLTHSSEAACNDAPPQDAEPALQLAVPIGALGLEVELLACSAAVQALTAAADEAAEEPSAEVSARVLRFLGSEAEALLDGGAAAAAVAPLGASSAGWRFRQAEPQEPENPAQLVLDSSAKLQPSALEFLHLEPRSGSGEEEEEEAEEEEEVGEEGALGAEDGGGGGPDDLARAVVGRLARLARRADREDAYEVLWQALAWRCRARILNGDWSEAASDATKALMLNVFAAAELRAPVLLDGHDCHLLAGDSGDMDAGRVLVPPTELSSVWSCLRMRAVALHMDGQHDAARSDALLLLRLSLPPQEHIVRTTCKALRNARHRDDDWHRTTEQRVAMRCRRRFRRDGVFELPRSL